MSLIIPHPYPQKDYSHLKGLKGISDAQLAVHFALYAGYVTNTNKFNELIAEMSKNGQTGTHPWAETNRRLGWEYNGMRLHEYYFGNLFPSGKGAPGPKLKTAVEKSFGSFDAWKTDFIACGSMRGIGWVILYRDPQNGILSNHWITEHDLGHPAGFTPILVLDVFEHAFMIDYKPADRRKYIDAFFENLDWNEIENRLI
jgi:superoxide dismutase, Fe-Mn family